MPGGASQAALLIGPRACLAGLVARLADALGVRVAPRRTGRHARPVMEETNMFYKIFFARTATASDLDARRFHIFLFADCDYKFSVLS